MDQTKNSPEMDLLLTKSTHIKRRRTQNPKRAITRTDVAEEPSVQDKALQLLDRALNPGLLKKTVNDLLARSDPTAIYKAFQIFEQQVGGREKLLETLAHCPVNSAGYNLLQKLVLDPDFLELVKGEEDEAQLKFSLEAICSKNKVPFTALISGFKDARIAQLTLNALTAVGEKSQQVIEQIGEASTDRWTMCTKCKGQRRVKRIGDNGEFAVDEDGEFVTQLCWICRGEGQVFAAHDWQNRNKFLEIVGITKKEPLIQQSFDQRSVSIGGGGGIGLESTMKALDNLLRGKSPEPAPDEIIDVQPLNNQ
jgi:hypothetical protein